MSPVSWVILEPVRLTIDTSCHVFTEFPKLVKDNHIYYCLLYRVEQNFQRNCMTKKTTFKIKYKLVADMIYAILMEPGMTLQAQKNLKSFQDLLIFQLF